MKEGLPFVEYFPTLGKAIVYNAHEVYLIQVGQKPIKEPAPHLYKRDSDPEYQSGQEDDFSPYKRVQKKIECLHKEVQSFNFILSSFDHEIPLELRKKLAQFANKSIATYDHVEKFVSERIKGMELSEHADLRDDILKLYSRTIRKLINGALDRFQKKMRAQRREERKKKLYPFPVAK